jgi:hypothetical protein
MCARKVLYNNKRQKYKPGNMFRENDFGTLAVNLNNFDRLSTTANPILVLKYIRVSI